MAMCGPYPDGNSPADAFILIDIDIEALDALQNAANHIVSIGGDINIIFIIGL